MVLGEGREGGKGGEDMWMVVSEGGEGGNEWWGQGEGGGGGDRWWWEGDKGKTRGGRGGMHPVKPSISGNARSQPAPHTKKNYEGSTTEGEPSKGGG